jgi:hypothetical protein
VSGSIQRPLLFLDVDGPLLPFRAIPGRRWWGDQEYPGLSLLNPAHGPLLLALPVDLVWATAWEADANALVGPRIGLPELPVVMWPDGSEEDERRGLHWKTRTLISWAAGRAFVWLDDEITDADREWVAAYHPGRALLHRVDPFIGLTEADLDVLTEWLRADS